MSAQAVACPDAPLGGGDPSRRWGVRCDDGRVRWPGLTRPEAERLITAMPPGYGHPDDLLVEVTLDVVLSDGAGPHVADADGVLVLVLGPHPAIPGVWLAMGPSGPEHVRVGAVRGVDVAGAWAWVARAVAPVAQRVARLDELAAADGQAALQAWAVRANSPGIP